MHYQSFSHKQGRGFSQLTFLGYHSLLPLLGSLEFRCKYVSVSLLFIYFFLLWHMHSFFFFFNFILFLNFT